MKNRGCAAERLAEQLPLGQPIEEPKPPLGVTTHAAGAPQPQAASRKALAVSRRTPVMELAELDFIGNDNGMLTGTDHVQMPVPKGCEPEARSFFGAILELEEIEKPERLRSRAGCWFKLGLNQLRVGVEDAFRSARKAYLAFAVTEINAL